MSNRLSGTEKAVLTSGVLTLLLAVLGVIGWVMNVIKIFTLMGCDIGTETIIRIVFVFIFPLGAVTGWIPLQTVC